MAAVNVVFQGGGIVVIREGQDALVKLAGVFSPENKGKLSKKGLSMVIASTGGNQPIGEGLMLGLNAYRKV